METLDDFHILLKEALSYSLSKNAIVEEFKDGVELSIDVYVEGSIAKILLVTTSKKIQENKDSFTILQSEYPPRIAYSKNRIYEIVQKIVDAFMLHDTPLLVQMITNGVDYNVVEFSARMGGGSKYHIIDVLTGVNIMGAYVDMVMGERPSVSPVKKWNNALICYVYCAPGIFSKLNNFDEMCNKGVMHSYFTYKMPGSLIEKSTTSSDRVAGFLIVGNSNEEIETKLGKINDVVKVLDPSGKDIMRHDFFHK